MIKSATGTQTPHVTGATAGPAPTGGGATTGNATAVPASRQFDAPARMPPVRLPAPQATPTAPPSSGDKSLIARMQAKLFARAVVIQPGVTGTTLTRHRPAGPAAVSAKLPGDPDLSPGALLTMARQMQDSLAKSEIEVWSRPAPSPARQRLVKLFPFLSAGPTRNVARLNVQRAADVGRGPSGAAKPTPVTTPGKGTVPAAVATLIERIDRLQGELEATMGRVRTAEQDLQSATQRHDQQVRRGAAPDSPELSASAEAVTHAQSALAQTKVQRDAAATALRHTVQSPDALMIASVNFHEQEAQAHTKFALDRIDDFARQVDECRRDSPGKLDTIQAAMHTGNEAVRHLMELGVRADAARQHAAIAEAEITRLSEKIARLAAGPKDADGPDEAPAPEARTLVHRLQTAQTSYDRAMSVIARIEADHGDLDDAIARKMGELDTLLASHGSAVRDAHHAEKLSAQIETLRRDTPPAPQTDETRQRSADAVKTLGERIAQTTAANTSRFSPEAQADIAPALRTLTERMRAQTTVPMPDHGIAEIVSHALSVVAGEDGQRAALALDQMARHPAAHWTRFEDAPDEITTDVRNLCRELSRLPRGAELIHYLSADGTTAPSPDTRTALRVFWSADEARAASADGDVRDWLDKACAVAADRLSAPATPDAPGANAGTVHDDVAVAAFHAVRNGYTSNAPGSPYALHNERIRKASETWVMYANAKASQQPRPRVPVWVKAWRKVSPLSEKTPFRSATLRNANHLSERIGLAHPRITLDRAVRGKIEAAEAMLPEAHEQTLSPEDKVRVIASSCIVSHLKQLDASGVHLSEASLGPRDLAAVKRRMVTLMAEQDNAGQGNATQGRTKPQPRAPGKPPAVELPPECFALFDERRSAYEAMETINTTLAGLLPPGRADALTGGAPDDADKRDKAATERAALDYVRTGKLSDKTGVEMLLSSYVEDFRSGHRIRIAGGGTLGGGVPKLPVVASPSVVTPVFSAEASLSQEASLQIAMNTLSLEVSIGQVQTKAAEATVGAAFGGTVAGPLSSAGTVTGKLAASRIRTQATVLRQPRTPKNDDKTRNEMLDMIHTTLQWDTITPKQGPAYANPLEAILARHPTISVVELLEHGRTNVNTLRVAGSLGVKRKTHDPETQTFGFEASIAGEHEKTRTRRTESGGGVQINGMGVTAQQRATFGTSVAFSPIANQSAKLGHGGATAQTQSLPLGLSVTRDLYWHMDRKDISAFQVDGKFDADLDRYHAGARDMLAEISANRENWLRQAVSKMPADEHGEKNTPMNRMRAATQLAAFESAIRDIDKQNKLCHFQINYTLSPHIGPWIDNLRAIAQQAEARNDHVSANKARNDIDAVLQMPGAWHASRMAVRKRVKDQQAMGVRTFVRMQATRTAEGQQTLAQFPAS